MNSTMNTFRRAPSGQRISRTPCHEFFFRVNSRLRFPSARESIASSKSSKFGAESELKRPWSSRMTVSPPQDTSQSFSVLKYKIRDPILRLASQWGDTEQPFGV